MRQGEGPRFGPVLVVAFAGAPYTILQGAEAEAETGTDPERHELRPTIGSARAQTQRHCLPKMYLHRGRRKRIQGEVNASRLTW